MPTSVDLTLLRPGVRVKLRGAKSADPRKPWPRGWKTVEETDGSLGDEAFVPELPYFIRIESDERWIPVELIEEIVL